MIDYKTVFSMMAGHKAWLLDDGLKNAMQTTSGAKPDVETLKASIVASARRIAAGWFLPGLADTFTTAVKAWHTARGARPGTDANDPNVNSWLEGFDAYLLQCIGDTATGLGQSWVGEYLTDSDFDNPDILNRACQIGADNLAAAAIGGRLNGQVLAEIGIVNEDLLPLAVAAQNNNVDTSAEQAAAIDEGTARARVEQIVGAWAIKQGMSALDVATLGDNIIKPCFDDDKFLALGPIHAIGGKDEDFPYFLAYHKANANHVADTVSAAFMAAMTGNLVETPPPGKAPPKASTPPKTRKGRGAAAATAASGTAPPPAQSNVATHLPATSSSAAGGEDFADVIQALRRHTAIKEDELGKLLNVSRGTINNIVNKGKPCSLTAEEKVALIARIEADTDALNTALNRLVGL